MKSKAFVSIEAHIICCRLHHQNALSYSVGLKAAKDEPVSTGFKAAKDLIIDMNEHLTLTADKYSYEQFPKLTLIVNVISDNKERKTVGTTFANYKKEGVQTFQVSQCSCKDKAFQVDILFTTKLIQAKNSNKNATKLEPQKTNKGNYMSQQVTPRQSRQQRANMLKKLPREHEKKKTPSKEKKLQQVKSEKVISGGKTSRGFSRQKQQPKGNMKDQLAVLNQKIKAYQAQISDLQRYKKMLFQQQINSQKWYELFKVEQEKSSLALSHIASLEKLIQSSVAQSLKSIKNTASSTSFKIIEQHDQILMINQQLQTQLDKQKTKNKVLHSQIVNLKLYLEELTLRIKVYEEKLAQNNIENQLAANKYSMLESAIGVTNEIQILSKIEQKKVDDFVNISSQQESKRNLKKDEKYSKQLMRTEKSSLQNPKAKLPPTRAYKKSYTTTAESTSGQTIKKTTSIKSIANQKQNTKGLSQTQGESVGKKSIFESNSSKLKPQTQRTDKKNTL